MAAILFNSLCALLLATWTSLLSLTVSEGPGDDVKDDAYLHQCFAVSAHALIGEHYSEAVQQAAKTLSGASSVRLLQEGGLRDLSMVSNRLTITLDLQGRIVGMYCG